MTPENLSTQMNALGLIDRFKNLVGVGINFLKMGPIKSCSTIPRLHGRYRRFLLNECTSDRSTFSYSPTSRAGNPMLKQSQQIVKMHGMLI
jgi:hypothetical protein